tara:strand:+ start:2458 stop:2679 length:222 start_codon:yes stop_codon:yes gene_type:complete
MTLDDAREAIYTSLDNDNEDIDVHIANLKSAMKNADVKEIMFQPSRLPVNNRDGRKTMQSYFKKRGVKVGFAE